jgi:hypothetical protein
LPSKFPAHILKLSADALAAIDDEADRDALKSKVAQAIRTAYLKGLHTK